MVHNGRELLSEAGYFHSFSMDDDPGEMADLLKLNGLEASALSAHCPLMRPEIAVPYLQKAIRFAAAIGAPVVNTDEGIRPEWVPLDEAWGVMRYTLKTALRTAERYGIFIGIEPHQSISTKTEGLLLSLIHIWKRHRPPVAGLESVPGDRAPVRLSAGAHPPARLWPVSRSARSACRAGDRR